MTTRFLAAAACSVITLMPAAALADDLNVVATFSILGDFAAEVGGDRITLHVLVGPDSDAHVYEPRPADAAMLSGADVILTNGLHFEGFLSRLVEASGTDATIVELSDGATILEDVGGGHDHGHDHGAEGHDDHEAHDHDGHDHAADDDHDHADHDHADHDHDDHAEEGHDHAGMTADPHAWQSVANAQVYVRNVAAAFCAADPGGCATYEANAAAYLEDLAGLDAEIRTMFDSIPVERRVGVVVHNAFQYFEQEYALTFLSPQGTSTGAEASAAQIADLVREIREQGAQAIFAENIADTRLLERIGAESGLTIAGTLHSDALSGPGGTAPTYIEMMRSNATTIAGAFSAE